MNTDDNKSAQPLRELEWLINYFKQHCREDLAKQIFEQLVSARQRAQASLADDASEVIDFSTARRKKMDRSR